MLIEVFIEAVDPCITARASPNKGFGFTMSNCVPAENAVLCRDVSGELFGPFEGDWLNCMATGSKPTFRIAFGMGNETTGWRGCDISAAYLSCIMSPRSAKPGASSWPCVVGIDAVGYLLHHGLLLAGKSMTGTSVVLCKKVFPAKAACSSAWHRFLLREEVI
jgi:hypothetical protein